MAAQRLASAALAGRRRAASAVVAGARNGAGVRGPSCQGVVVGQSGRLCPRLVPPPPPGAFSVGGGGQSGRLWPRPRVVPPPPPPHPRPFSSGDVVGGAGGSEGAAAGGSGGGAASDISEILRQVQQLVNTTNSQIMPLLRGFAKSLQTLRSAMNRKEKVDTAIVCLAFMASAVICSLAIFSYGIHTGDVDVHGLFAGIVNHILDDPIIAAKLDTHAERMAGHHQETITDETVHTLADYTSVFAFVLMSAIQSGGGAKNTENSIWLFLNKLGLKENPTNKLLLDMFVREGYVLREDDGGVIVYILVDSAYQDCIRGKLKEKIWPILRKEFTKKPSIAA